MIEFFSHFSTYGVAAMMVLLFVVLSLISLRIVRRFCKPMLFTGHTEFGEIFSSAIGVVFALILAFVAVAVWQNYEKVDDDVFREANFLHNIYRNLEAYPEPVRTQAKNLIHEYVQVVINDEWPKLAQASQDVNAHQTRNRPEGEREPNSRKGNTRPTAPRDSRLPHLMGRSRTGDIQAGKGSSDNRGRTGWSPTSAGPTHPSQAPTRATPKRARPRRLG